MGVQVGRQLKIEQLQANAESNAAVFSVVQGVREDPMVLAGVWQGLGFTKKGPIAYSKPLF